MTSRILRIAQVHRKGLGALALVYLLLRLNKYLSRQARDNGTIDRYDWTRDVVLITGGSSGIGAKLVQRLSERGIKVVILDLQAPETLPPRAHFYHCDITSKPKLAAVHAEIEANVGSVTVLINNAGVVRNATILEKTKEDLDFTFGVNAYSHYWTVQEFMPSMISRNHGHIITISSLAAFLSTPNVSDYNMSKAAITAFHETLGLELKHVHKAMRVRTSILHPSYVKTALHDNAAFGTISNPLLRDALDPDQVAAEIEKVVLNGESRTVMVPTTLGLIGGSRGWSEWLFRALLDRVSRAALQ